MKLNKFQAASFMLLLVLLAACTSTKDTSEQPVELEDFKPEQIIKTLWHAGAGDGTGKYQLKLEPYLESGKLYVADYAGRVSAFDQETGERLWKIKTDLPVSGGMGGSGELLFLGIRDGYLLALRQSNGEQAWKASLTSELLSPAVAGLGVVVARTVDGNIQAFAAATGEKLWSFLQSVPVLSLRGSSRLILGNGAVISGTDSGQVAALSLLEGKLLWETRVAVPSGRSELDRMVDVDGDPLIEGGIIYAASFQGRVAAISSDQGQVLWARDKSIYLSMSMDAENLYAVDELSHAWGFDRTNGATLWTQEKLHARPLSAPVSYKNYVLFADFEGYIHVLAKEDGRLVARTRIAHSAINAAPLVDGDVFYVLTREGDLFAMQIPVTGS